MSSVNTVFIIGTAGSGKTLLSGALREWLESNGWGVTLVNLDPGVDELPYSPDVDCRDYVRVSDVMEEYGLGPNGALILSVDMIASRINEIVEEALDPPADYIIVDTPGQLELFVYRPSGSYIVNSMPGEKATIFLFDGWLSTDPINFLSLNLLASSVETRVKGSFIPVLSKADIIEAHVNHILFWSSKVSALEEAVRKRLDGTRYSLYSRILRALANEKLIYKPIPVSATTGAGFANLSAAISNVFSGGEEKAG